MSKSKTFSLMAKPTKGGWAVGAASWGKYFSSALSSAAHRGASDRLDVRIGASVGSIHIGGIGGAALVGNWWLDKPSFI
jgi:hypothetical protein